MHHKNYVNTVYRCGILLIACPSILRMPIPNLHRMSWKCVTQNKEN